MFLVHAPCVPPNGPTRIIWPLGTPDILSLSVSLLPCLPLSLEPALYKNRLRLAVNLPASSSSHSNAAVSLSTREPVRCTRRAQKREKECDRFSYSFQGDRENQLLPGCCASRHFISWDLFHRILLRDFATRARETNVLSGGERTAACLQIVRSLATRKTIDFSW